MEEKPVIYSDLLRKRSDFNVQHCIVEKALPVSHGQQLCEICAVHSAGKTHLSGNIAMYTRGRK